jgi:hypothetical protein
MPGFSSPLVAAVRERQAIHEACELMLAEYATLFDERATVMELLEPGRIGVELSEEFQLHPEPSTSAVIVHHPEAKYVNAR